MPSSRVRIMDEVQDALATGMPVVALESTIISHGMPFPANVETAQSVENEVRNQGAVPATIAILDGEFRIGLLPVEMERLGKAVGVVKASRRDIPVVLGQGGSAGTTVSGTMIGADLAGIRFFATGGIGGVHRGAQTTFDVSADLQELGRTSVVVISAGAKAILDLPLTLEYLETLGVPVIGFQTDEFPAFYTRESGLKLACRLNSPREVAQVVWAKWDLGLGGGVLVANPIPEAFSLPGETMRKWIDQALQEAIDREILGGAITPFLLGRLNELTGGESLRSNIELVKNNARLAGQIAQAFSKLAATGRS